MTYFWAIVVFLAPLLLGTVACFDFYAYLSIYFDHRWDQQPFRVVRKIFCPDTFDTKCLAPILGGQDFDTVDDWCMFNYNATDCYSIRQTAQTEALTWGKQLTLIQASVCLLNIVQILGSVFLCVRILTAPVITQSMNDVINYLLLLPIGGCAGTGAYIWWMRSKNIPYNWLCEFFIAMAVVQVIQVPLGIAAGRMKDQRLLTVYIALVLIVTFGVASAGVVCIIFSVFLPRTYQPTLSEAADIACDRNFIGCCCCQDHSLRSVTTNERCPEWTVTEVVNLTVLDVKIAGVVAFLCLMYLFGALIVAGLLRENLKNYKSEFI